MDSFWTQKRIVIAAALGVSVVVNVILVIGLVVSAGSGAPAAKPDKPAAGASDAAAASTPAGSSVFGALASLPATGTAGAAITPVAAPAASEMRLTRITLNGAPEREFIKAVGALGDALSQTWARLWVWDVNLRSELARGDETEVLWRVGADNLPEIWAATLKSAKKGKTFRVYRFKAPGDTYASYWFGDGTEVPYTLRNGPLQEYEQITSLLKDRPKHKGMDFKTPTGTIVQSPFDGTVTRVNWNWTNNGNCVEVRFDNGILAKFLHLSENRVKEGERVPAGHVIALSGNTGHSTAPHLHYQLNQGEKVVDPVTYHGTVRRKLDEAGVRALATEVARLDGLTTVQTAGL